MIFRDPEPAMRLTKQHIEFVKSNMNVSVKVITKSFIIRGVARPLMTVSVKDKLGGTNAILA